MNDDLPDYDTERVAELIGKHRAARTRREQREIENEILEVTVWETTDDASESEFIFSETEVRMLHEFIQQSDADEQLKSMVRGPLIKDI
jgi:Mn-dependent DtxR family transcriptional regulator